MTHKKRHRWTMQKNTSKTFLLRTFTIQNRLPHQSSYNRNPKEEWVNQGIYLYIDVYIDIFLQGNDAN